MSEEIGQVFFSELSKIIRDDGSHREKLSKQSELLVTVCHTSIKDTGIQFHTVFSIIAYAGHRYNLPGRLLYNVHRFRRETSKAAVSDSMGTQAIEDLYLLGIKVLSDLIRLIYNARPNANVLTHIPSEKVYLRQEEKVVQFKKYQRILVLERLADRDLLVAIDRSRPDRTVHVRYNIEGRNEIFNDTIALLEKTFALPLEVNLIDVEIDEADTYMPRALVLEPDYLVDITAVAGCFRDQKLNYLSYFTKKFLSVDANKYLMLGNIANYFLDELMADESMSFRALIGRVFKLNPLVFSQFDDATSREIVQRAQKHFVSLKQVVKHTFPKQGINVEDCFLEPTFYSEQYGLQGRLDVLHDNPALDNDAAIIELKSGKPFRANAYGLSHDHYVQTLLYDLLIKSMSGDRLRPTNYILYSVKDNDHLRFAPAVRSQQYEALAVRNQLIAMDRRLARVDELLATPDRFMALFGADRSRARGFTKRDIDTVLITFEKLSTLEKQFFLVMTAMIAREHRLAKVGSEGQSRNRGQAALWINTQEEKEDLFNVISFLRLSENCSTANDPILKFARTERTNPLANFRKGDLALVHPWLPGDRPLSSQLFKGTIVKLDAQEVWVRLRAKQFNDRIFQKHEYWSAEHDSLDSSFLGLYRSLLEFASAPLEDRQRFLTVRAPQQPSPTPWKGLEHLTAQQNRVMQKMLEAEDYFLLWGPPGTGKTSIMLKGFVEHLYHHTEEEILLLAYTNRAVDEVCTALQSIAGADFIRIGSRYSTHPDFISYLLSSKTQDIENRQGLRELFGSHRIVVGTLSSVLGRRELFALKDFDRVIIDEATQVLEPMMAGLLPRFHKVLMIGDHQQLPAVIAQPDDKRLVQQDSLHAIGLYDGGNSCFERLYRRCEQEGWDWAFDKLMQQGRMHQDIMEFPSTHFYNNMLETLPEDTERGAQQTQAFSLISNGSPLMDFLSSSRVLFIPVYSDELRISKTNVREAKLTIAILKELETLYQINGRDWDLGDVGIITPYRSQIAMIRRQMAAEDFHGDALTVDTVERYQGGARNVIIISLCVNSSDQLDHMVSLSSDGVDRKLNVALTRAREQLIVLGNPTVLATNGFYKAFIKDYQVAWEVPIGDA
ncbi:MAG: AAA family ATPase [Saprospiraceae bacterium]|nr:AAA family ATPase [Saprospiraceae bacterium]